ncbi:gland-specific fatty acyl-CoA reductase 1 [Tanacetum coccineum]
MLETPYYLGESLNGTSGLDIDEERKIVEEKLKEVKSDQNANEKSIKIAMKNLGMQRSNHYGWPNTYVFTKALGEMLIGHLKGDMPVVIIRPTIVTSTYKEPFPGWVEGIRTIDSLALGYGKGKLTCFLGDPEAVYDVVPADMVVNAMIASIAAHANQTSCETIYHVGSSVSNPLQFTTIQQCGYSYFAEHPLIEKDGKAIIVGEVKVLNSMASFHRYIALRYLLPLQVLRFVNLISCQAFAGTYKNLKRKIAFVLRLVELYKPYLFTKSYYDDMHTEKLRRAVRENGDEENIFYFDPRTINWADYFQKIHMPGLRQLSLCSRNCTSLAIIDRQLPFKYTIASRSTDMMVMALLAQNINHVAFRSMLDREKLSGTNLNYWFRSLRLVLRVEKKLFTIEQPIPPAPVVGATNQELED